MPSPATVVDSTVLRGWAGVGTDALEAAREEIDELNVYPVHGNATDEVLRAVDLAEVTLPPTFGTFAVHLNRPSGVMRRRRVIDLGRACSCLPLCTRCRYRSRC